MNIETNVQVVKKFLAALGSRDEQGMLALADPDIEWVAPGEGWPLAGTYRGHAGLKNLLEKAKESLETQFPKPPEFVAQGDRVMVVGIATGKTKSTNKTWEDHWVFDVTVQGGKLAKVREYVDTQALAQACRVDAISN